MTFVLYWMGISDFYILGKKFTFSWHFLFYLKNDKLPLKKPPVKISRKLGYYTIYRFDKINKNTK